MSEPASLLDDRQTVHHIASRLAEEFDGVFSEQTIERVAAESLDSQRNARVKTYIPLFAERFARERLRAAAKTEGAIVTDKPTVLFLCVHNAGRSQMAAGWLRHLAGDQVEVMSGGSAPAEQVNAAAVESMREVGVDISDEYPKPWTEETLGAADVLVTMGCGDACPVYPGKRYLDWQLDDPRASRTTRCGPSATTSNDGCAGCSRSWVCRPRRSVGGAQPPLGAYIMTMTPTRHTTPPTDRSGRAGSHLRPCPTLRTRRRTPRRPARGCVRSWRPAGGSPRTRRRPKR